MYFSQFLDIPKLFQSYENYTKSFEIEGKMISNQF